MRPQQVHERSRIGDGVFETQFPPVPQLKTKPQLPTSPTPFAYRGNVGYSYCLWNRVAYCPKFQL